MLALAQAGSVRDILRSSNPDIDFDIVPIKTTGDKILDAPLAKIGDKGLFTKEIENELLSGSIDIAVHSMKDMPTMLPDGLAIGAITERLDPRDVFVSKDGSALAALPAGAAVATGSLRRRAQLRAFRPDLTIVEIRGNVQSRLKKMRESPEIDGIILACAGITRLQMSDAVTEIISEEIIIPAVGQASLAIEIRSGDSDIEALVLALDHRESRIAVSCERAYLAELGGGCQVPIGGYATVSGDAVSISGMVASLDGKTVYRNAVSGPVSENETIGKICATKLLDNGAKSILDEIYGRSL